LSRKHLQIQLPEEKDFCRLKDSMIRLAHKQEERDQLSEPQVWLKCWCLRTTTWMSITNWKMLIFTDLTSWMPNLKLNTLYSQRDKVKESGKSYIKLLILRMCYCMFLTAETQMEPELSLLSNTWSIDAPTNISFSFWTNVISYQLRLLRSGSSIYPRSALLLLSKLRSRTHSERDLLFSCWSNLICFTKIKRI